jgi:hypothetical protein
MPGIPFLIQESVHLSQNPQKVYPIRNSSPVIVGLETEQRITPLE